MLHQEVLSFESERLIFRTWKLSDVATFVEINQDPRVLEFFPSKYYAEEVSVSMAGCFNRHIYDHGYGLFAAIEKASQKCIGFIGIQIPSLKADFMPCVEIGWRLSPEFWGKGYATEGARRMLSLGFETFELPEIVAFAVKGNERSVAVMNRIGMLHDAQGDFKHPSLEPDSPYSDHVLYRLSRAQYLEGLKGLEKA